MNRTWKLGDDVDTDQIVPGRFAPYMRPNDDVGDAAFIEALPEFNKMAKPGDVIIAGDNFGCGSSREYAPLALQRRGIAAILARSYARIFYRNAINLGIPVFIEPTLVDLIDDNQSVVVDLADGTIEVEGRVHRLQKLPEFAMRIIQAGGIAAYVRKSGEFPDVDTRQEPPP